MRADPAGNHSLVRSERSVTQAKPCVEERPVLLTGSMKVSNEPEQVVAVELIEDAFEVLPGRGFMLQGDGGA